MSFIHSQQTAASGQGVHFPLGHSASLRALILDTDQTLATTLTSTPALIRWEDASNNAILIVTTADSPISVTWGNASSAQTHKWIVPAANAAAWQVETTGGTDYILVNTTGAQLVLGAASVATKVVGNVGFFNATPVAQQTVGAVTNNVTSGGTTGTIANYTDLVTYANDAAAIRNNLYQLARSVAQLATAVRNLGLGA